MAVIIIKYRYLASKFSIIVDNKFYVTILKTCIQFYSYDILKGNASWYRNKYVNVWEDVENEMEYITAQKA